MSAPIRGRDNQDDVDGRLQYAPPWIREQRAPETRPARFANSPPTAPAVDDPDGELEPLPPRFEGDVAMEAIARRLSLEPERVPEPPVRFRRRARVPWLRRLMAMCMIAGLGAFGAAWLGASNFIPRDRDLSARDRSGSEIDAAERPHPVKSARAVPTSAPAKLVVESQRGGVNEPLALGVSLEGKPSGETLLLAGFADGTRLSAGAPLGRTGWRLSAADLDGVVAYAPQDFVGAMDATVDLRSAGDRLIDSRTVRLEWLPKSPPDAWPAPPRERALPDQSAAQPVDAAEVAALIKRGLEFLKSGDIASARLVLRRAAASGNAQAALTLGATFDGTVLTELGVLGFTRDEEQARSWYRKAAEWGSKEAERRLEKLAPRAK